MKKFKVYLITDEPGRKVWQELRDGNVIMKYTAILGSDCWTLYSKLGTRKATGAVGDLMRTFPDLENLCLFLGVNNPSPPS